jgi:hypothetical protein
MKSLSLKIGLLLLVSYFATSCSQSKSSNTSSPSTCVTINGKAVLATCSKAVDDKLSLNVATFADQVGNADPLWVKVKFNTISPELTKSGVTLRFYRMKGVGNDAVLDNTSLQSQTYNLSTAQPNSNLTQTVNAQVITTSSAFYVYINDPQSQYQILKVAFFDSTGKTIENFNILIPEFLANPAEYLTNADGTSRGQYLQDLHPLKNTATTGWSSETFNNFFQQFCF